MLNGRRLFNGESLVYTRIKVASYTGFHLKCHIANSSPVKLAIISNTALVLRPYVCELEVLIIHHKKFLPLFQITKTKCAKILSAKISRCANFLMYDTWMYFTSTNAKHCCDSFITKIIAAIIPDPAVPHDRGFTQCLLQCVPESAATLREWVYHRCQQPPPTS